MQQMGYDHYTSHPSGRQVVPIAEMIRKDPETFFSGGLADAAAQHVGRDCSMAHEGVRGRRIRTRPDSKPLNKKWVAGERGRNGPGQQVI